MSKIDFFENLHKYPSTEFKLGLEQSIYKLNMLDGNSTKSELYFQVKNKLSSTLLATKPNIRFNTDRELLMSLLVLMNESDILKQMLDKGYFFQYLKFLWSKLQDRYQNKFIKQLLLLYYRRYFSFLNDYTILNMYVDILSLLLDAYSLKNKIVSNAIKLRPFNDENISKLLNKVNDVEQLKRDFAFEGEFFEFLRLTWMLKRINELNANTYSLQVKEIFDELIKYKNISANIHRTLIEEATLIMLRKCKPEGKVCNEWLNFMLSGLGDPRNSKAEVRWKRVGEEYYYWVRSLLSQGDVREFLETLTDGMGDDIYKYRKQFWSQYIDYVQYAKIMLGRNAYERLKSHNPEMYQRFQKSPETYSRLNEKERSCIYIDLGDICVIEGSHSARVRLYRSSPINLSLTEYNYSDFQYSKELIYEKNHQSSDTYSWQNNIRNKINEFTGINISINKVVLPEDQKDIRYIRARLWELGHSIS